MLNRVKKLTFEGAKRVNILTRIIFYSESERLINAEREVAMHYTLYTVVSGTN
jgi:hypothetical protein